MKMRLSDSIKKWAIAAAAAALLVWCAADIDWSTLNYFSWGTFKATIANLCKPDFAAFYTGSSEDIFHLMLLTVGIGFFGTTIGTVLAVPFTLLASRSLWKNPVVPRVGKFVLVVLRALEACHAVGANGVQTMFYARLPQLMPIYASLVLNHFEIAVRSASTLGLVGAGGIGATLIFAIQACRWSRVGIILLTVIATVFLLDMLTGWVRKKLR